MTTEAGDLSKVDVAILAGGLGTRLRPVLGDELPKVLAPVHGRPFLEILVDTLEGFGVRHIVLCLGHLADKVIARVPELSRGRDLTIETVVEPAPLGTGGALRFAADHLRSDPVMVMNGDSWVDVDLAAMVAAHCAHDAFMSLLCVDVPDTARYGRVEVDEGGAVVRFTEKGAESGPGLINAGTCLLSQAALAVLRRSEGPSLERDFMPTILDGRLQSHVCEGAGFIDIGTPDSFSKADKLVRPR